MELDKTKAMKPDSSVYPQTSPRVKIKKGVRTAVDVSSSGEESERDTDDRMELDQAVGN